ncbi:Gx transporter family protein [Selenomonas sp. TAMA-11512]|uniref:Gx transporter family protein n=1 Tax=Selenomonas sp. TAMA-11512 TaxID=3095337 RepID=UPI0030CAA5F5
MRTEKITRLAMLLALSLVLFIVELQIPFLPAVPGLKLGLANVVTLFLLWYFPFREVVLVLAARVLLASFFAGGVSTLAFSLAGGLLAVCGSACLHRLYPDASMLMIGILGAILHHTGQIAVAVLLLTTTDVLYYYPFLLGASFVTGSVTGCIASLVERRLRKHT